MANTQVTGDLIANGAITAAKLSNVTTDTISEGTALYYTDARVASYLSANSYATEGYVTTAVNNLVDAAPASLDTLNELAAALNDDANFATTVTNALATKLNLSGGNITGNLSVDTNVLFVDTVNDRVGVGTSSPTAKLHIGALTTIPGGMTSQAIIVSDTQTGGSAETTLSIVQLGDSISSAVGLVAGIISAANPYFAIKTRPGAGGDSVERMRITSTGNVGIGTSSPVSKLGVYADGSSQTPCIISNTNNNVDTDPTATQTVLKIVREGKPGSTYSNVVDFGVSRYENSGVAARTQMDIRLTNGNTGDPDVTVMSLRSNGNVGIGTSSPALKLDIQGNSAAIRVLEPSGSEFRAVSGGSASFIGTYSNTTLQFLTNAATRMTIDTSGNIGAPSGTNIYNASDARLKQNIVSIENGLDTISNLNPVKFNWIDGFSESEQGKDMLGFVAQEVQQVLPEAVESFSNNSLDVAGEIIDNPLRVNEKFIIPVLVKAIQELKEIVDQQQIEIDNLKAQLK